MTSFGHRLKHQYDGDILVPWGIFTRLAQVVLVNPDGIPTAVSTKYHLYIP